MSVVQSIVSELSSQATARSYKKGSVVLYQGEAPRMAYIIKSGAVKVYTINNAGEEQIVTLHTEGDIFPSSWIFGKSSTTLYYYETFSPCELLTVPREVLTECLRKPANIQACLDYFVTNHTGMMMRVTALQQARARDKIMFTLYYLTFRYGKQTRPGVFTINLPLTHGTIASLVGLTRETTTTELNKLKQEKVVQYARHNYRIYKERLERLLGEDSFSDVSL
jgi:CRP/FNR family transcriptional regulator